MFPQWVYIILDTSRDVKDGRVRAHYASTNQNFQWRGPFSAEWAAARGIYAKAILSLTK